MKKFFFQFITLKPLTFGDIHIIENLYYLKLSILMVVIEIR